jgi:hypothetical protein
MSNFFNLFPRTLYKIDQSNDLDTVINLTANFSILQKSIDATQAYFDYVISEGDTPEIVSYKIYNDPEYHWLIMRINGIMNLNTDWPLTYSQLMESIDHLYGITWAQTNYKTYYKIETRTLVKTGESIEEYATIDADTYASLTPSTTQYTLTNGTVMQVDITKERFTYFDTEVQLNENKRNIRVIKAEYKNAIKDELERVLLNG